MEPERHVIEEIAIQIYTAPFAQALSPEGALDAYIADCEVQKPRPSPGAAPELKPIVEIIENEAASLLTTLKDHPTVAADIETRVKRIAVATERLRAVPVLVYAYPA